MSNHGIYIPPEGPPSANPENSKIYYKMGEENIYKMMQEFYFELEQSTIRQMFPQDMVTASKRSAEFFIFLMGGPPIYQQKHGHPMMRKRHIPFVIDETARQEWLRCFRKVLDKSDEKYNFPKEHLESFWEFIQKFSGWMVNTK